MKHLSGIRRGMPLLAFLAFSVVTYIVGIEPGTAMAAGAGHRVEGHIPRNIIARSVPKGPLAADTTIPLVFSLQLRDQPALDDLLARIYNPSDPLYGHYLSPQEFNERFAPTQADYDTVAAYAKQLGFKITKTHSNRLLLSVSAKAAQVESGFSLHLQKFEEKERGEFYAPDDNPDVPDAIASRIEGIVGLDNATMVRPHALLTPADGFEATPLQIGTGPGGALTPANIITAYNLGSVTPNGGGQTLALFEVDGYNAADVSAYASYFSLPKVPLKNILVDGFSGSAGGGASEVTLDIELMMALAPGASQILVYEGPNSGTGILDTYNRIATDNLAAQISTSWGMAEGNASTSFFNSENSIFKQMAAQGQTFYAASGDSGAYDNGSTLSVDDPASQPYVTGTGGTKLSLGAGGIYASESSWNENNTIAGGAGGGGISSVWTIPSWQQGTATLASASMRNVPDVSLDGDPSTGYSIYYNGGWWIYGGTSCTSPLWAAFTARVNQQRASAGLGRLGFANPVLYQIGQGSGYGSSFHDVKDGSTNLYYTALTNYDNSTGWGSFNGAGLFAALTGGSATTPPPTTSTPPSAPTSLAATAGNASVKLTWSASSGATSYNVYRGTSAGGEGTTPVATGITSTSYTDSNLANGTTYYYKVGASNSAGNSPLSNEASAKPTAPTSATAITGGPTATVATYSVKFTWTTNVPSNSVVKYGTSPTSFNSTVTSSSQVTSHAVTTWSIKHKTTYYYQVSSTANGSTATSPVFSFTTH